MRLNQLTDHDIDEGIKHDEFYLLYQPIVCLQTGKIVSYEALARWDCVKRLGMYVTPDVFTNFANLQTSRRLTGYLLAIAEQAEKLLEKPIHFNLTCYDLHPFVGTSLQSLEIVEHIFVPERIHLINHLASKGFDIWIDDLGSGYSPWQYLPRLNVAGLKVDRELTQGLLNYNERTRGFKKYCDLISGIAWYSQKWGLKTVAECVETEKQCQKLCEMNIDYGQGWYFSKAIKIEEVHKINGHSFTYFS